MDADDVVRLRLRRQQLRPPNADSAESALQNLLAVQSQEFAYARWSLGQRTTNPSAADVEQAVADGRILRTHILRPTWHCVHRDDLRWLTMLSAPRLQQANARTYRQTGIDAAAASRSARVLAGAVAGGAHKTRDQLAAELQRHGFTAKGLELAYLIMHAEISGVLVSGTPVRSAGGALRQTYALFDERVPQFPDAPVDRPAALTELVRRYFTSRGPATVKDCADWSGLTVTDVRLGLRLMLEAEPGALRAAVLDGVEFYLSPDASGPEGETSDTGTSDAGTSEAELQGRTRIDLIQCYDEYVMGYSRTRHFLGGIAPAVPQRDTPPHVVLQGGRMVGSWRHVLARGRCELDIRTGLDSAADPAIDDAVAAYGRFLGMPTTRK
ncbi:winged helix DNA-binding domain-containing protein [Arthrobacter sp. ISL-72]|uniref:winged helix DNA-binding domain-containing protein n=1 Tax=Arthrobacter sp. ISL-72 TaxID=2819114 RepID=UPI001BE8BB8E|nr:winged helix DNA-binding domain-containing protein [Arthrobacter sp. ISL-72]MBT2595401.1 AlkZ family DNA glycosylase [Arthrobacter sp. ISL-72]